MCFGYLIHYWREKNIRLSRILIYVLWVVDLALLWLTFYSTEFMKKPGYDNQALDNFLNSFRRPLWALGLGWLILACAEGFGGPINWFLSLKLWKLPARISYAMYLLHVPILDVVVGAPTQAIYFSMMNGLYLCFSQYVIYFIASFIITVMVDFPCSNIIKIVLGDGFKKSKPEQRSNEKVSDNQQVINEKQS
ncbi:O-acyltransferase like protein-like [Hyposmocoma kahamanoa]|uniref:O-acyltransferase like protein-like n=1 Tax=Hyposmocoma kahamanoa TaxID=1477025 RepID=UPI000E6D5C2A|nr:O-acyltransferase like protein-like [Hyposmocoma kahamanoa]